MKILYMCVANSARSQLAEGLAKQVFAGTDVQIESAGSNPSRVNPLAIAALQEAGIDISRNTSKTVDQLAPGFLVDLDYVITLCAEEVCPILVSKAKKLHWPLPDPAGQAQLSREAQLQSFRDTRDEIKKRLLAFKQELAL